MPQAHHTAASLPPPRATLALSDETAPCHPSTRHVDFRKPSSCGRARLRAVPNILPVFPAIPRNKTCKRTTAPIPYSTGWLSLSCWCRSRRKKFAGYRLNATSLQRGMTPRRQLRLAPRRGRLRPRRVRPEAGCVTPPAAPRPRPRLSCSGKSATQRSRAARRITCVTDSARHCIGVRSAPFTWISAGVARHTGGLVNQAVGRHIGHLAMHQPRGAGPEGGETDVRLLPPFAPG